MCTGTGARPDMMEKAQGWAGRCMNESGRPAVVLRTATWTAGTDGHTDEVGRQTARTATWMPGQVVFTIVNNGHDG